MRVGSVAVMIASVMALADCSRGSKQAEINHLKSDINRDTGCVAITGGIHKWAIGAQKIIGRDGIINAAGRGVAPLSTSFDTAINAATRETHSVALRADFAKAAQIVNKFTAELKAGHNPTREVAALGPLESRLAIDCDLPLPTPRST